jgi:hypothetical protein
MLLLVVIQGIKKRNVKHTMNENFIFQYFNRLQRPISYDDDDLENSYFRRKPTSFLSSDAKRHTWVTMNNNDDSMRMEESRMNRNLMENGGPYVVESYPQKSSFLSQSTEQITG